jgi:hypothetical protein
MKNITDKNSLALRWTGPLILTFLFFSGTTNDLNSVHFPVDATTGFAVGEAGTILKTTDGRATWTAQTSRPPVEGSVLPFRRQGGDHEALD